MRGRLILYAVAFAVVHSLFAIVVLPFCMPECNASYATAITRHLFANDPPPVIKKQRHRSVSDPVRFAWGVISEPQDVEFRSVLLQTYLSDNQRICPLSKKNMPRECQIAFTFVVEDKDTIFYSNKEDYVTHFSSSKTTNIRSSWFHYASQFDVDYVAQVDMHTLVIPSRFLDFVQDTLSSPKLRRVYGGYPRDRWECGGFKDWKCRQMTGQIFMDPSFYFLSSDLARRIPDNLDPKDPSSVANWVFDLPMPVMQASFRSSDGIWEEGPTTPRDYRQRWNYLSEHRFAKNLLSSNADKKIVPRYEGKALVDEFYRRVPWKWFPDRFTRWNLP